MMRGRRGLMEIDGKMRMGELFLLSGAATALSAPPTNRSQVTFL